MPSALISLKPFRPLESETDSRRGHVGLQAPQLNVYFLFDSIVFSIFCFQWHAIKNKNANHSIQEAGQNLGNERR